MRVEVTIVLWFVVVLTLEYSGIGSAQNFNDLWGSEDEPDSEVLEGEETEEIVTTKVVRKKYYKEINNLQKFRSKSAQFMTPNDCVKACRKEVCNNGYGGR